MLSVDAAEGGAARLIGDSHEVAGEPSRRIGAGFDRSCQIGVFDAHAILLGTWTRLIGVLAEAVYVMFGRVSGCSKGMVWAIPDEGVIGRWLILGLCPRAISPLQPGGKRGC